MRQATHTTLNRFLSQPFRQPTISALSSGLVGAAVSYQVMGYEYTDYGSNNEDFKTTIYRSNFAIRGLFHYGNNDMLDMYSGVRFGMTNWTFKTDYDGADYDVEQDVSFSNGTLGAPQLILFGIRGYFYENWGANLEFAIGSPHYLSIGFNYRF